MFNIINLNIYHLRVIFISLKNVRLLQITIKKTHLPMEGVPGVCGPAEINIK